MSAVENIWTELVVRPPNGTTGVSVSQLLRTLSNAIGANFVVAEGIDGANVGNVAVEIAEPCQAFAEACLQVRQFDWADIYLLSGNAIEKFRTFEQMGNYPEVIQQTLATIRVVDGEYLYVYSRPEDSLRVQQNMVLFGASVERNLHDFIFPE